jgi:hypothetical protein
MTKKYGSFDVNIKCENGDVQTHTVNPLTQHEIANDWRLVLPRKKVINKLITKNNDEKKLRKTNESFFKINLAQLPPHLFNKYRPVYRKKNFIHYIARDNCYVYIVHPTPVDNEIKKLVYYLELYKLSTSNISDEHILDIKKCLTALDENDVKGWVVLKASRLFNLV